MGGDPDEREWTRRWYLRFADGEARGRSAQYEEWARGVAADDGILDRLVELPRPKRQPNLLLGASRLVGAPASGFAVWRAWLLASWDAVEAEVRARWTQTNEVLRCAALVPALATIPGPIALLEVGASAGLCLLLDRYSYVWRSRDGDRRLDPASGPSTLELLCDVVGDVPVPERMPDVVWRAGIERDPIDAADPAETRWLETLVWPEEEERRTRLRTALAIARAHPPRVVRGDAVAGFDALAAEAPEDATLVVLASAAIVYLAPDARADLLARIPRRGARLVSLEGRGVVPGAADALDALRPRAAGAEFVLAVDDRPLALVDPHGRSIDASGIRWEP